MSPGPPAFVTYGWCRVSYVILQSLAARGVEVHVGDSSRLAMCRYSRQAASFSRYRSPYQDPAGFVDDVAAAMTRTGARVLIPGHEDALVIARLRDRLPSEAAVVVPHADQIAEARSKWHAVGLAQRAGVRVPRTVRARSRGELEAAAASFSYPAVVKTDVGNSAKGVAIVTSREECLAQFDALVRRYGLEAAEWPMIQAFAGGDPHGVCLLYNRGQLRASFTERYLRAKDGTVGTSVFRESVHAPVLEEQARALMDGLDWHGPVHLDFLYDRTTGHSALIEINPRFWGALDLAVRAGVDFPWLLYRIAVDGDVAPVTSYRVGVRSRWIAGEMLHLFNEVRRLRMRGAVAAVRAMRGQRADGFDDFRGADPAPLAAELLYYVTRGVLTGSINPVEDGMIG